MPTLIVKRFNTIFRRPETEQKHKHANSCRHGGQTRLLIYHLIKKNRYIPRKGDVAFQTLTRDGDTEIASYYELQ